MLESKPRFLSVPVERLHELLECRPEEGRLFWKVNRRGRAWAGSEAFTALNRAGAGYRQGRVDGVLLLRSRVIWAHCTGAWPLEFLDHVNGDSLDDRLSNLREATHQQNMRNRRVAKDNRLGIKGVYETPSGKFCAYIRGADETHYHTADTLEAAVSWRAKMAAILHKEFARQ